MPSYEMYVSLTEELKKSGISPEVNSETYKKYKPYELKERLSMEAIGTICLYAERHGINIVLGDSPEIVYRQNIANSLTLLQLQNILTHCAREIALYPDLKPQTPLTVANLLYPEVFLQLTDTYISTLFEYMIYKKYNNIISFVGMNQSVSLTKYLDNRKVSSLEKELKIKEPLQSIVRDFQGEEIVEKHAILDLMYQGKDILEDIDKLSFRTTYAMIEKYADYLHIDTKRFDMFRKMHIEFLNKYQVAAETQFEIGKVNLRREYMSKLNI